MIDINKLLFRASQVGHVMQSDNPKVDFTETCIDKMVEIFNSFFYHRYEEITSKFFNKGNAREEDSITLVSIVLKKFFVKNKERRNNEFITGEWDLHVEGEGKITETLDIKSCWSKNTFDKIRVKKLNLIYFWQGMCYLWLTGAIKHTICYCLVNGTFTQINDEIRKLSWRMGVLDNDITSNPEFAKKVAQIERNHIFDIDAFMKENPHYAPANAVEFNGTNYTWAFDIPKHQRVFKVEIPRDEKRIKQIEDRVKQCRAWIYNNLILTTKP